MQPDVGVPQRCALHPKHGVSIVQDKDHHLYLYNIYNIILICIYIYIDVVLLSMCCLLFVHSYMMLQVVI